MASPAHSTYSVGAGSPIHGGRWPGGRLSGAVDLAAVLGAGALGTNASDLGGDVALGAAVAAGTMDDGMPAWWHAAPVGQWVAISGTAGPAAGLNTNAYSDMTLRPSDSTLLVVAAGGHSDGSSNGAASLRLSDDAPAWTTLRSSSTPTADVLYYGDGRPTSRHTYHYTHYIESLDAVLLAGCRFGYGGSTPTGPGLDLFSLSTNDYLARYTWPDLSPFGGGAFGVCQDGSGHIWTAGGYKINGTTGVLTKPGSGSLLRYPAAYDSIRDKVFALQFDDGEGFGGAGLQAVQLDPSTGNSTSISFNGSAGLTAFNAAGPDYAAMAYCPLDGKFYFMHPGEIQKLYVITPNGTTTWDMAEQTIAGTLPASSGALCKRFLYVPQLSGFVVQTAQASNLYFMRVA
ncbi:MAG: hypothetical protein RL375_2400 [Pseudomonadota bacterium]